MMVEVGEFGAGLIAEDEQLGLFRVDSPRLGAARLVWRDPPPDRRVLLTPLIASSCELVRDGGRWCASTTA